MILDLSYKLKVGHERLQSVNEASDKSLAPQHSMYELGNVIPRIIWQMAKAPDTGVPILFSKIDLKDGYWRMVVDESDAWNFAYVLPPLNPTDEVELVIPDSLQMGWSESPPFFCAATETARDIAEASFLSSSPPPAHPMEDIVLDINWTNIPKADRDPQEAFLHLLEVYIDDFIALIQSTDEDHIKKLTRCLLNAISDIFPPPEVTGSKMGPPISIKKLIAEGTWETRKEILGWLLDGIALTIELPSAKYDTILAELKATRRLPTISTQRLRKLQGKLQFASIALPIGKPLLGPIDIILTKAINANKQTIVLKDFIKLHLRDWSALLHLMQSRPTHVRELVTHKPSYQGLVDASKWGVGGVWFSGTEDLPPFVWYLEWPQSIRDELCSPTNKNGRLSISDLELMGIFMHWMALEQAIGNLTHKSVAIWCDNIPAVSWIFKFRTSTSIVASAILKALATRMHVRHAALMAIDHISGLFNVMADVASRKHSTNPTTFLTSFSTTFPPPQDNFWTLFQFSNNLTSKLFSALCQKPLETASWRRLNVKGCGFGQLGKHGSLLISPLFTPTYNKLENLSKSNCWQPSHIMCDPVAFQQENTKYVPKRSRWHSAPLARKSNWTDNRTRWLKRKENIQRRLVSFSKDTDEKIHPQPQN